MVDEQLKPKTKDEFMELIKWGIVVFGFKVAWDVFRDSSREDRPPNWEKVLVDEYYDGRLDGVAPRQKDLAERFRVSQQEASRTIRGYRDEVREEWDEAAAERSYKREVSRIANLVGLRRKTVAVIIKLHGPG